MMKRLQKGKAYRYNLAQQVGLDPRQTLLDFLHVPDARPQ